MSTKSSKRITFHLPIQKIAKNFNLSFLAKILHGLPIYYETFLFLNFSKLLPFLSLFIFVHYFLQIYANLCKSKVLWVVSDKKKFFWKPISRL